MGLYYFEIIGDGEVGCDPDDNILCPDFRYPSRLARKAKKRGRLPLLDNIMKFHLICFKRENQKGGTQPLIERFGPGYHFRACGGAKTLAVEGVPLQRTGEPSGD